jgi:hypothetical protein
LIEKILGEVISGGKSSRGCNVAVVTNQFRRVLVCLGIEEAVEPVEAPA